MYQQLLETLSKIIYGRRIRHVEMVGRAATMAKEGRYEAALSYLAEIECKMHRKVRSIHAFTRAKVLDEMGRETDAESEMIRSAKLDPANFLAHLELARMSGRHRHFENAKARFQELTEVSDATVSGKAKEFLHEIEEILNGSAAKRLAAHAEETALTPLGPGQIRLGMPVDLVALDQLITELPELAAEKKLDLAILLGQSAVLSGGTWQISLALPCSCITFPGASDFNPFSAVTYRLAGGDISILKFPPSDSK